MKTSVPRLRSVRLKNGGALIRVLRPEQSGDRLKVEELVRETLSVASSDIDGFVFMVWDRTGASTCAQRTKGNIPSIYVPDFVRNRLLGQTITNWALDDFKEADQ